MTILPFRRSAAETKVQPERAIPRPVIGITSYGRDEKRRFRLSVDYVDAVRTAGGIPIILPPEEPAIRETFDLLDGLILSGGGDIEPDRYGGEAHPRVYNVDARRDDFEFELCSLALEHDRPLLCICRGAQLLNVSLGGTLYPHRPDVVGEGIPHRVEVDIEEEETVHSFHSIVIDPKSRLAETLGIESLALPGASVSEFASVEGLGGAAVERASPSDATSAASKPRGASPSEPAASQISLPMEIASWHHQSVQALGEGLRASAWAADGTIEAFELAGGDLSFVQAIQWHPEITAASDPLQQRLFEALVEVARRE